MYKKKLIVGVIAVLFLAAGTAGFFYWRSSKIKLPWQPTPQGIFFEELLPPDVSFVISFHPADDAERQRFEKIWGAVLQDKKDVLLPFIIKTFSGKRAAAFPLADVLALFGDRLEFTVALTPGSEPPYRNIYLLFRADDPPKIRAVFERMKESYGKVILDTPDEYVLDHNKFALGYSGIVGDVGFFAFTSKENSEQLLARFKKRNSFRRPDSLASARDFKKAAQFLKNPMSGYIFFAERDPAKFLAYSAISFGAREDGLAFDGITFPEIAKSDVLAQKIFQPFTPSLASKIPLSKALLYEEAGYVGSLLLSQFDFLAEDFQKLTGFNFETDILPFLDKDLVFSMEDTGGILPTLSLWMDASAAGAQEKAKAVFEKLDAKVASWATLGNIALASRDKNKQAESVFEIAKLTPFTYGTKVTIYPDRIDGKIADMPFLQLIREPLEISYGLEAEVGSAENIFFFSTRPNFSETFSKTARAENHPLAKRAQSLDLKPGSTVFIDGAAVGAYAERVADAVRSNKKFSQSEEQSYALLKKYLSPIKNYVQSGQGDGKKLFMSAFLEIRSGSGTSTQP